VTTTRRLELPSGAKAPVLGVSTWGFAEDEARRYDEIATLRAALDAGLTLIDTAELYARGGAEQLVARAIAGRRDETFLVSKVLPEHATRKGMVAACAASLRRLGTDRLDLYLLHWRGRVPLEETIEAFTALVEAGMISSWGVANFRVADLAELHVAGGSTEACNQVLYNLLHREIEHDLLPWCLERDIPVLAYLPHEAGRILSDPVLDAVAARHGATPAQIALAWVLRHERVGVVARADTPAHVHENCGALDLRLDVRDITELDDAFPRPVAPRQLVIH
jgi:diketogulonate reductase-like aldo/keto reductase